MERLVLKAGSPPSRTALEGLSDIANTASHLHLQKLPRTKTHLQVKLPGGQYDMFSGRLLEGFHTWISMAEQLHPTDQLGHVGGYSGLQGDSYDWRCLGRFKMPVEITKHSRTCRLILPKLVIQPCECSPCRPAADGAQIVALRQTEPSSPLIAKMFPALTLSTTTRSRPIIV